MNTFSANEFESGHLVSSSEEPLGKVGKKDSKTRVYGIPH